MLNSLCDDLPHLTAEEIETRCQAIRLRWSGHETAQRKIDSERQMRVLDFTLRFGSYDVSPKRSLANQFGAPQRTAG
ncbi:hypothetical protein [Blastopirellula marina]|uniref:Uncharacterized protein n=1 Tax=Blastopirellula marina TaxID=124 RepID=A0A2S8GQQ2_9BACT|nr:hypothetical protein [Blastopirellula marina]PQO46747.1 hypothetical protein C5Y93_07910 [Blastopirellula marina]